MTVIAMAVPQAGNQITTTAIATTVLVVATAAMAIAMAVMGQR